MPLSRQTSRIVWPSKPSTTRPSTSIRIARRDLRSLRRLRLEEALGSDSAGASRSVVRRLSGRVIRSAMVALSGRTGRHRDRMADAGRAGAVQDVLVQLGPEVSHPAGQREGRQPLVVAQGGGRRCRRDRSSRSVVSVGRGRPSTTRSAISTRRRVPIRHGIVLPHASSAQNRVSSRARSTTQARSSATTTEPEPTWAPAARSVSKAYGVSSSVGRQEAARTGRRPGRP